MPPKKGVPNRRGAASREQILDAAVELFARRGYRGTGLLALGERVGMSHVGILRHFGTKENLLKAVMARRDQILERLAHERAGTGITGLTSIPVPSEPEVLTRLATVLRAENLNPDDPLHDYFNETGRRIRTVIAAEIRAGQDTGQIRSDINPDVKALEIVAFGIGIETQWLAEPDLIDRAKVHDSFVRALIDDLTRPDAPRRVSKKAPRPTTKTEHKNVTPARAKAKSGVRRGSNSSEPDR
jgi:AcrR family transcriptional regulator